MGGKKQDVFNIGEIEARREALQKQADEAEKQMRINFGITFSTREGFEVLKAIMQACHAGHISYVQGDQMETIFREGERNIFLFILSHLSDDMKQKILIGG